MADQPEQTSEGAIVATFIVAILAIVILGFAVYRHLNPGNFFSIDSPPQTYQPKP
jgi:hypothetical protein